MNYNYIYSINSWILLCPWWLCFDWSMGCVPLITDLTDGRMLFILLFLVIFSCLIYKVVIYFFTSPHHNLLIFSLGIICVTFLPASNLLFHVGFVIAERNLYLPSAGVVLLISYSVLHFQTLFSCTKNVSKLPVCLSFFYSICYSVSVK